MFTSLTQALGVDGTFFVQFLIFLLFYPILSRGLFRPYVCLQSQREKETSERMKKAEEWEKKKQVLEKEYKAKAKALNEKFNTLYDEGSKKLKQEMLKNSLKAKSALKEEYVQKRKNLLQEFKVAEKTFESDTNQLAKATLERLLS